MFSSFVTLVRQLDPRAARNGFVAVALLFGLLLLGSNRGAHLDTALAGYTAACLFAAFGLVYRYSVWLSKPPTRRFWRRGWQLAFSPRLWRGLRSPAILARAFLTKIVVQGFVLRRGFERWLGHMLIASGCLLAAAVTFPLVFGWVHFEHGRTDSNPTYVAHLFGWAMGEIPLQGVVGWLTFHALVVASFLVIPGVMLVMKRRMLDDGAVSIQRFGRDLLPLVLLFAVAFSGLLLWIGYEWLDGYYYGALAQFHAFTVIGTLLYLPFGKLFHVFQRPASLGISYYEAAGKDVPAQRCPVTNEAYASSLQVADVDEVLGELGFDYRAAGADGSTWQRYSPRGRRMLLARAQARAKGGRFA